jgi:uncharacterized delta-60 repeat protein
LRLKYPFSAYSQAKTSIVWMSLAVLIFLIWSFSSSRRVRAQGSPGTISFSQSSFNVNESDGSATITLTRTGGTDGEVSAKVNLADVTTSPGDYRFNPGALDPTFIQVPQASFLYYQSQIALQPDGKLLVASNHTVFRVNSDGSPDATFTTAALNSGCTAIALQPDGKVIIAGSFNTVNLVAKKGVARLNSNGSLDTSFDVGVGSSDVNIVALQTDGKVLVGGGFTSFNLAPNTFFVARLNTDGSVDSTFLNGANVSTTYAIVVQPNGKILVGGLGFIPIARMNSDGSADNTFSSDLGAVVLTIALQPDGKILVGGGFDHAGSQPVNRIARLHTNGTLDTTFNSGSGPDFGVSDVAVQPDGKVIIGGDFRSFNGTAKINLARLNADGNLDTTFNSNITSNPGAGFVHGVVIQPDGKPIVGGTFTAIGTGSNRSDLARLQGDMLVTWPAGDAADKTITLPIVDDLLDEPDEMLNLTLTPFGGATPGAISNTTLTIIDNDQSPIITSALPPPGLTRLPYSHMFTATGMPTPTFSVTAGALPPELTLQPSGLLSGVPTTRGIFSGITVTASNGVAPVATQSFDLTIEGGGFIQFASANFAVAENAGPATITVTRTGGSVGAASVTYSTNAFGGTATSGTDYLATSGTVNFADGETSKSFSIFISNDSINERDETVSVSLGNAGGSAYLGNPNSAVLTIQNDDPLPTISIDDVSIPEGNAGLLDAFFTVSLVGPIDRPVSFNVLTTQGTATQSEDYAGLSFRFQINQGATFTTIPIAILGDTIPEPDETFFVTISAADGATITDSQGVGTIVNDETTVGTPTVQFNLLEHQVSEGAGVAIVTVTRSGDTSAPLTVNYATSSMTGGGYASDRGDYTLALGTLRFAAGESIKSFVVFITDDALVEGDEFLQLALTNPTTGSSLGNPANSLIRILDNDVAPPTVNPIDSSSFFVRQHYRDFLNRDPDPLGNDFWINQIEGCGTDQACREVKRINVSAAFFISIEFQKTGYFVYLLHKAAFNSGELLQLRTFMGDTQAIGRGVVVGGLDWESQLEANKTAFVNEFVVRAQFATLFPQSMTPTAFVDALNANTGDPLNPGAGGALTQAERDQLITELTSGDKTRAQVVRAIAENQEYQRRQFNKAFVLMQYFGYLRRNPNSSPDFNFNGYNFWLAKLNQFNGNFINAEMVKAFISSSELRQRFGQP